MSRSSLGRAVTGHRLATMGALTVSLVGCGAVSAQAAAPGVLDGAFSGDGIVTLPAGTQLHAAAPQADGKVVAAGTVGENLLVARFTRDGQLDTSFSGDGLAAGPLPAGATGAAGDAIAVQADGKIVVAGDATAPFGKDGMLVDRFNPDGSVDTSFGSGGAAAVDRGPSASGEANAIAVRADGAIVVGGSRVGASAGQSTAAIAVLLPSGAPVGATKTITLPGEATILGLALQADGKIVYGGTLKPDQTIGTIFGRANADGTPDTSFGDKGVRIQFLSRNGAAASGFRGVAVQPDGKVVATGYAFNGSGPGFDKVTERVDGAGQPDASFGPNGVRYTSAAASASVNSRLLAGGAGIAINGGHIYTGGTHDESGTGALEVGSLTASGTPDAFGTGGETITPINNYAVSAQGTGVALTADGLYLVGTSGQPGSANTSGVIARYGAFPLVAGPGPTPPPTPAGVRAPAKLAVLRAGIKGTKLDVLASTTSLATGELKATFVNNGTTTKFTVKIPSSSRLIKINKTLSHKARVGGTGILTLTYNGNSKVRSDDVRLRAATGKALLTRKSSSIDSSRNLRVAGTISSKARGVVRIRLDYVNTSGQERTQAYRATIKSGKWSLKQKLPDDAKNITGELSIQFTGYLKGKIRGEQTVKQVKGG